MSDLFLFQIHQVNYAIPVTKIIEIVENKKYSITPIPKSESYLRGVANFRGEIIPIYDLRLYSGYPSNLGNRLALAQMLRDREQDHRDWLEELGNSVKQNRPFTLTTDPHRCKFGLWYDQFKTENRVLEEILRQFNQPHQKIHSIAIEIEQCKERQEFHHALKRIEETQERELKEMIHLFEVARQAILSYDREILLVLEEQQKRFAITIDAVVDIVAVTEQAFLDSSGHELEDPLVSKMVTYRETIVGLIENFSSLLSLSATIG